MVSGDRVGLLADAAAMLALQQVSVRAARAWTQDGFGVSVWDVAETGLDDILLRQRLEAIVDGRLDAAERLSRVDPGQAGAHGRRTPRGLAARHRDRGALGRPAGADPRRVLPRWRGGRLGALGARLDARARRRSTCSTSRRPSAGALSEERAASAAHAVRQALVATFAGRDRGARSAGAATLDHWS